MDLMSLDNCNHYAGIVHVRAPSHPCTDALADWCSFIHTQFIFFFFLVASVFYWNHHESTEYFCPFLCIPFSHALSLSAQSSSAHDASRVNSLFAANLFYLYPQWRRLKSWRQNQNCVKQTVWPSVWLCLPVGLTCWGKPVHPGGVYTDTKKQLPFPPLSLTHSSAFIPSDSIWPSLINFFFFFWWGRHF